MKQIQFTSAYNGYRVNEIASFEDAEATSIVALGVATLIGDTVRVVPESLADLDRWETGNVIIAAHTPYTFIAPDPVNGDNRVYQIPTQATDWTMGASFDAVEEALYVEVCTVEDVANGGELIKLTGAGDVAVNFALFNSNQNFVDVHRPEYEEKEVSFINTGTGTVNLSNDLGGVIYQGGSVVASVSIAQNDQVSIIFGGNDMYLGSFSSAAGGGPSVSGNEATDVLTVVSQNTINPLAATPLDTARFYVNGSLVDGITHVGTVVSVAPAVLGYNVETDDDVRAVYSV